MKAREFRLGDKVFCNKHNLNGVIEDFKAGYFTVAFENKSYGRYKPETMNKRFLLFEEQTKFKNVIHVDFTNKRIA